jgi:hypothetical protein
MNVVARTPVSISPLKKQQQQQQKRTLADHACDEQVSMGGGVTSFVEDEQVGQVVPGQLFRFRQVSVFLRAEDEQTNTQVGNGKA